MFLNSYHQSKNKEIYVLTLLVLFLYTALKLSIYYKMSTETAIIILAAGIGKRMNSEIPKVLHKLNNVFLKYLGT